MSIYDYKIIDYLKNLQYGGTKDNLILTLKFVIGLLFLVIGFILCIITNPWKEINAEIQSSITNQENKIINLLYIVNNTEYTKIISLPILNEVNSKNIKIYYDETNPNLIRLYNFNYTIIGIIIMTIGIFILINYYNKEYKITEKTNDSDLYSRTVDRDNIKIVYTN